MNLRPKLERTYWWLEKRIDPGVRSSQERYAELLRAYVARGASWLDIGCGRTLLPSWIAGQEQLLASAGRVVGLDPDEASLRDNAQIDERVNGSAERLPFRPQSFDLVTANMVVEHVADPPRLLEEVSRILRPGGHFVFHTSNRLHYQTVLAQAVPEWLKKRLVTLSETRDAQDIFPALYRMNDWATIHKLASQSGMELVSCTALNTSSTATIFLLGPLVVLDLLYRRLLRADRFRKLRSNYIVVLRRVVTT